MFFVAIQAFLFKVFLYWEVLKVPQELLLLEKRLLFGDVIHPQGVQERLIKLLGMLALLLPFRNLQRFVDDFEDPGGNDRLCQRQQGEGGEARGAEQEIHNGQADVVVELIALSVHVEPLFQSVFHRVY